MSILFSRQGVQLEQRNDTLWVSGDVDATTAAGVAAAGSQWLAGTASRELNISFEKVGKASSAALSILLQWVRACRQQEITLLSVALSPPLRRLADLAELDALLTFSAPSSSASSSGPAC
ncbi:STAS domain-containing protein [Vreelandella aquamarina]